MLTGKDIIALRGWIDCFDSQMADIDDAILRGYGARYQADHDSVTFLELDILFYRQQIDDAVRNFIQNGTWPKLSLAELRLLLLRMFTANELVIELVNGGIDPTRWTPVLPDDLDDKSQLIRWFLIDIWNAARPETIKALIDSFLRARDPYLGGERNSDECVRMKLMPSGVLLRTARGEGCIATCKCCEVSEQSASVWTVRPTSRRTLHEKKLILIIALMAACDLLPIARGVTAQNRLSGRFTRVQCVNIPSYLGLAY